MGVGVCGGDKVRGGGGAGHKSQQGGRKELKSSVQFEDKEAEQIGVGDGVRHKDSPDNRLNVEKVRSSRRSTGDTGPRHDAGPPTPSA